MRLPLKTILASCGAVLSIGTVDINESRAQTALPQVDVTVASPIRRAPAQPCARAARAGAACSRAGAGGAGRHAPDRHRPVRHRHGGAERRAAQERRRYSRRPAVRETRHHRIELRARGIQPPDHPRAGCQPRAHPGGRHRRQWRIRSRRRPLRAGRPAHQRPGRGHPRARHVALRLAGDRRRGRVDQQPRPDHHSGPRHQRRVSRFRDVRERRP